MHSVVAEFEFWLRIIGAVVFVAALGIGIYIGYRLKKTSK